jgi:ABC-2 type transport system permease protein
VRTVLLIARRELSAKLRTTLFVVVTVVSIVVLAGLMLVKGTLFSAGNTSVVGLSGQAISVAPQLTDEARKLGREVQTKEIPDPADGERMVADGDLDALVSGAPANLTVLVRDELNRDLKSVLDVIVQQQVLRAQLAAIEDLNADQVLGTVAGAHVGVRSLHETDPKREQRLTLALVIMTLVFLALALYGSMLAQGIAEERSARVTETLLTVARAPVLLAGKLLGLGLVGLIQLTIAGLVGLLLTVLTGSLTITAVVAGSLFWVLLWFLLGFWLYGMVFAAVGALISRPEQAPARLTAVILVLVLAFVLGITVLAGDASSAASTVLSLIPPFTPILMPGKIALGAAAGWQILLGAGLTVLATAGLALFGGPRVPPPSPRVPRSGR